VLFYRDSLAMATFAIVLTALLRKLQNASIEVPSWISFATTFVSSSKVGHFLITNDEESKITDEVTEENSDLPKSGMRTKETSWRPFAAIIETLSFLCVAFIYFIIVITLIPISDYGKNQNNLNDQNTLTGFMVN
jgi:hypothetical protein